MTPEADCNDRSLLLRISGRRAITQHALHFACKAFALILGQGVNALSDMSVDGGPIIAVALCRLAANRREGRQLGMRLGIFVHL